MIAMLSGKIIFCGERYAVLDVRGVGYKVYLSADGLRRAAVNTEATFWTHTHVREDALDLFGFGTRAELEFFEMLIGISGVGPRSALSIISVAPLDALKRAVAQGDMSYLTKVSGIGKKTAEKIVLELRDKLGGLEGGGGVAGSTEGDALDALEALGYSVREAREALQGVPSEVSGTEARLKAALKILGKQR